jgi:hypothetical protein
MFIIISGFYASLTFFIDRKEKNKSLNLKEIISVSLKNSKRLIVPIVLSVGIILLLLFGLMYTQGVQKSQEMLNSIHYKENLELAILVILFAPFCFASSYFSIENMGVLKSLRKSFAFSLGHPKILSLILVFVAINYIFRVLFFSLHFNTIGNFMFSVITEYFGLLLSSYILLAYRNKLSF